MKKDFLDYTFEASIIIKGIDGIFEIIGGFLLLLVKIATLNYLIVWLTQAELLEDPSDLIANAIVKASNSLSIDTKIFGSAYLLSHGLIKIFLVWSLLKNKLWAYPAALAFLLIFIAYQSYKLIYHYSAGLLALTIFDIFIVFLTLREYRKLKLNLNNPV